MNLNPVRLFRSLVEATPPGALRPSTVLRWAPPLPPVTWAPHSGELETHWDWTLGDALAIPGVWRARMLISQAIGAMPIGEWRDTEQLATSPLLDEPNPGESRASTIAAWVCDLLDHGNALGLYVGQRTREGNVRDAGQWSVMPWPASRVEVSRDGMEYRFLDESGQTARFASRDEVFHAKGTHRPGDSRGMGVLEAGLSAIGRMTAESDYAARAFRSGTPSGLLKVKDPDLQAGTPDDAEGYATAHGIKRAWKSSVATGDIAVMSELVDFQPLSWTPTDAQMVEARQMSLVDVANLYNLDPYWIGTSQVSAPYQNVQQAALQLSRFTLGYWITELEAEFSRRLPGGREARFNRDTILREESSTRVGNELALLSAGVVTVDEVRTFEGLPPLAVSDPGTVTPMSEARSRRAG